MRCWRHGTATTGGDTVGDLLLDGLLSGVSGNQRRLLVTVSAARDQEEAGFLATRKGPLSAEDAATVFTLDGWRERAEGPAVLPPVLHRLLGWRLARRAEDDAAGWETIHRRLRPAGAWDSLNEREQVRDLYHALALGELRYVTRRLSDWLVTVDGGTWLGRVRAVTAAPRRTAAGRDPAGDVEALARAAGPAGGPGDGSDNDGRDRPDRRTLTKLVAGLWIAADPFTCADRQDLHLGIAAWYRAVATYCPEQESELYREARRHDIEAERWVRR